MGPCPVVVQNGYEVACSYSRLFLTAFSLAHSCVALRACDFFVPVVGRYAQSLDEKVCFPLATFSVHINDKARAIKQV